jgi:putative addiction module component (TIGR02574 family)
MNERVKRLSSEIRKLPPDEQAALIDDVLGALHHRADPEIEKAWADEAKRRWKAYLRGGVETTPAEQVFSRLGRKRAKAR